MARIPTREALKGMKRTDLQKLCKDHNVHANLKTETIIDLLLNASKLSPHKAATTSSSRTVSAATRTSSRRTSGRSRGPSKSSIIIHDSEDEDEQEQEEEEETTVAPELDTANETDNEEPAPSEVEPTPAPSPPPATRIRKAKDTQSRLGKGRPVIAGGTGARAVTKSVSVSKGNSRGRGSRTGVKPIQETIFEEELEQSSAAPSPPVGLVQPEASGSSYVPTPATEPGLAHNTPSTEGSLASLEAIDKRVADALRPLHTQMSSLKSEVERLKTQVAEIPNIQLKVQSLTTEVEGLRSIQSAKTSALELDMKRFKEDWTKKIQQGSSSTGAGTPGKVTPGKYGSLVKPIGWSGPSAIVAAKTTANGTAASLNSSGSQTIQGTSTSNMEPPHPGFAAAVIGKRRRDSDASNITGIIEEGHQDEFSETELEKRVIRPDKKRAKLDTDGTSQGDGQASSSSQPHSQEQQEGEEGSGRVNNFTVFSGPDEPDSYPSYIDPPPPTNHLPDFFAPSPDNGNHDSNNGTQTTTANAAENQNPFGFNFLPMSSTPMHPMYPLTMPNFPYPEAPTSPSPVGVERAFQPFGMPPPRPRSGANQSRPGSRQDGDGSGTVNPAALTGHQDSSSNDVASGLGLTRAGESTATVGPAKRTMYGTELDSDTRFGDFGMEGVATGFWAGGRF